MKIIKYTDDLKNYELAHWIAHKDEKDKRPEIMKKLFPEVDLQCEVAADVGCGPHCGIFNELTFEKMYAVDPLWDRYKKKDLALIPKNVETICEDAEGFLLPEGKADVIFSFNSLDHSGNLEKSFKNIMNNLKEAGDFYFHVHMRRQDQLNAGHKMVITEDDIDGILSKYKTVSKRIEDICPLDNKKYRSYIAHVKWS